MMRLTLLFILLSLTCVLSAQPQGYYDNAQGKVGNDLKIALHNIIKNDDHVSYKELLSAYQRTDKKPDGTVWDIYSDVPNGNPPYVYNFSDNCGNYQGEGDCYNREHLWAQSWTNDDAYHKTDIHHYLKYRQLALFPLSYPLTHRLKPTFLLRYHPCQENYRIL